MPIELIIVVVLIIFLLGGWPLWRLRLRLRT